MSKEKTSVIFYVIPIKTEQITTALQRDIDANEFPILVVADMDTGFYTYISFEQFGMVSGKMIDAFNARMNYIARSN